MTGWRDDLVYCCNHLHNNQVTCKQFLHKFINNKNCNPRKLTMWQQTKQNCLFVSSGMARLLAVYVTCLQPCQRWGLELAQCAAPLTMGLVLYILRVQLSLRVSLARCQWCGPVLQVEALGPTICYPRRRLSPHPDAPNPGVMACHSLRRGHRRTILYLPENLISQLAKTWLNMPAAWVKPVPLS